MNIVRDVINLNNLSGIPSKLMSELKNYDEVLMNNMFMETIIADSNILSIIRKLMLMLLTSWTSYYFLNTQLLPQKALHFCRSSS